MLSRFKIIFLIILYFGSLFGDTIFLIIDYKNDLPTSSNLFKYQIQEEQVNGTFLGVYEKIVFVLSDKDEEIKKIKCKEVSRIISNSGEEIQIDCNRNNESLKELYHNGVEKKTILFTIATIALAVVVLNIVAGFGMFQDITDGDPWD